MNCNRCIATFCCGLILTDTLAQQNYVRVHSFLDATGDESRALVSTVFYDGLGRERWTVSGSSSVGGESVSTRTDYDRRGNMWHKWLPVPGDITETADYESISRNLYGGDEIAFSTVKYEGSGRNRPISENGPGRHWSGHDLTTQYFRNDAEGQRSCRIIMADVNSGCVTVGNYYAIGALAVVGVTDADGMYTLTFTNRDGKVVLERRIGSDGLKTDTRFVYDLRGDLRYAITPEGCRLLPESGVVNAGILYDYAQAFAYDFRHRCISFKLPGCEPNEYIYDKMGNIILSANAEQRAAGQWTVTKYDYQMRPAVRGISTFPANISRDVLQAQYDNIEMVESFIADSNTMEFELQYTNKHGPANFTPYEAWYYDNYDFMTGSAKAMRPDFETSDDGVAYTAIGLCTGKAFLDATNKCYYRATKYDGNSNVTRTSQWDCFLNMERYTTETAYSFINQPLYTVETLEDMFEGEVMSRRIAIHEYGYDAMGRPISEMISVDGGAPLPVCMTSYDAIGRVSQRRLGATKVNYEYDIRQHTKSIASSVYTETVSYEGTTDSQPMSYNYVNHITDTWSQDIPVSVSNACHYDGLGRLCSVVDVDNGMAERLDVDLNANVVGVRRMYRGVLVQDAVIDMQGSLPIMVRDVSAPYFTDAVGRFAAGDYSMSYDRCGRLVADGTRSITSVSYHPWRNLPRRMSMANGDWIQSEYLPDGSLLSRIFNTRRIVTITTTSAAGDTTVRNVNRDLRMTRTYRGSFEIASGNVPMTRINTTTGYYDYTDGRMYYYITNRQGSIMAVVDDTGQTVQRTGFYPSGTPYILPTDYDRAIGASTSGASINLTPSTDHLHCGNRWIAHSGLNRYDNTARLHDPILCRFDSPDPLSGKYLGFNPWTHCASNPANATDPDGRIVMATLSDAQMAILNTVPCETWNYVKFDKDGYLNTELLNQCLSDSQNFSDLVALANSKIVISVEVTDVTFYKDKQGNFATLKFSPVYPDEFEDPVDITTSYVPTTGEIGHGGKTVFPTTGENYNSVNSHLYVFLNPAFSEEGRAQMFSHEGFGHALFYIKNPYDLNGARHKTSQGTQKELNHKLMEHVINAMNETHLNYKKSHGK